MDELYQRGIIYITKFTHLYVIMVNKRKELLAELQQVRKEHISAYVLAREIYCDGNKKISRTF